MREKELRKKEYLRGDKEKYLLVLYNDEVNTFDHVIKSLVEVCGHDSFQAEQCALLAHFRGSCDIKSGTRELLLSMSRTLNAKRLESKVHKVESP